MDKVLVKWTSNWDDEMEIEGLDIMRKTKWEALKKKILSKKNFCIYIGTHEEINYASGEDLLDEIKVRKITPEEEKTIKKFIGASFGHTNFLYILDDEEDVQEEELIIEDDEEGAL
jgi:hypothetical protein